MTDREQKRLEELLKKKEAEEQHDREFFAECRKRKDEVLKAVGATTSTENEKNAVAWLTSIAKLYDTDMNTLLKYIQSERQVSYFKSNH